MSGGGLYLNLIPKEGGNVFSGSNFFGYTAHSFQGDNLTDDLQARGVTSGDAVDHIYDFNVSVGGPIMRDKLWFFGSFRDIGNGNIVANSFYADGRPGINDQTVKNMTARLTSQLSPRNKVTAYMDRAYKNVFHSFSAGQDPATASVRWPPILYYTAAAKWTATVTNKLLFELGVGAVANNYAYRYQEGIHQDRGTPAWYATAARQDIALSTLTTAASSRRIPLSDAADAAELGVLRHRVSLVQGGCPGASGNVPPGLRRERRPRPTLSERRSRTPCPCTTRRCARSTG